MTGPVSRTTRIEYESVFSVVFFGFISQKLLAVTFVLSHPGSVAYSMNKVKREIAKGKWRAQVNSPGQWFDDIGI